MEVIQNIAPFGELFIGLGWFIVLGVLALLLAQAKRWVQAAAETAERYSLLETCMLDRFALSKNIDLNKEVMRREALADKKKEFQSIIREELYEAFFGKREGKTKK